MSLERYKIEREIGRGAMGIVWLAKDADTNQEVALKELSFDQVLSDDKQAEFVHRFEREASAAAKLDHPSIISVTDTFSDDDRHFLVMEYLDGPTLDQVVKTGPLPPEAAIGVASQILSALIAAHDAGIVHRDLKPENIFVLADGTVKVADFGIAHVDDDSGLTRAGQVLGTLGYMAPEQVRGQDVDARADIFAMGVILYEMLIGTNPFHADQPTTIMYRISYEEPPALDPFIPELPGHLTPVIRKATAKEPDLRYQSAAEMLADLESGTTPDLVAIEAATAARVAAKSSDHAGPTLQADKPKRAFNKKVLVAIGMTLVLLLGVAGGGYAVYQKRQAAEVARKKAIITEGQQVTERIARLKKARSELSSVVDSLKGKSKTNAAALKKWDQEWQRRRDGYDRRSAEVAAHNQREQQKYLDSSVDYYDWWGYYSYTDYTYNMNLWDDPQYPNKPGKVKVSLESETKRLAELEGEINALRSEISSATPTSKFFGPVYQVMGQTAQSLVSSVSDVRKLSADLIVNNAEKGHVIDISTLNAVNLGNVDPQFQTLDQQFATALGALKVTLEEIIPAQESSATVKPAKNAETGEGKD